MPGPRFWLSSYRGLGQVIQTSLQRCICPTAGRGISGHLDVDPSPEIQVLMLLPLRLASLNEAHLFAAVRVGIFAIQLMTEST